MEIPEKEYPGKREEKKMSGFVFKAGPLSLVKKIILKEGKSVSEVVVL